MKPILFSLGPLQIHSYGVLIASGLLISAYFLTRRAHQDGFPSPPERVLDLILITVVGGFLGARIYYVIQNFEWYALNPVKVFAIWEGGLIFYGGVIGSLLALFLFMKFKKIPLLKGLDFLIPYVALTHAFGRMGCFFNGCCYGRESHLPWAIQFPHFDYPVHPTQLYEVVFNFCLFLFLNTQYPKRRFDGQIISLYLILYAVGRFGIEFFRGDNPIWLMWTSSQWVSLGVLIVALIFFGWCRRRHA